VDIEVKRPLNIVVPVRLSSETYDALCKEADQLGIGPGALIKTWVLEKLSKDSSATRPARTKG
jgi:hypothetical protein